MNSSNNNWEFKSLLIFPVYTLISYGNLSNTTALLSELPLYYSWVEAYMISEMTLRRIDKYRYRYIYR